MGSMWLSKQKCMNMFYRKLRLAILILFYCPWSMSGQIPKSYVFGESDQIVLPVTYINGFIIVDVIFQKILPLKFILDTGAENTILLKREYAEMLNIPFHKKIKLMGADMSEEVNAYICNGTFIQLTNTRSVRHNIIVLEKDYLFLEEYIGTQVDGILGAEFFKDLILKIDYKLSTLTIYDPEKYNYSRLKNYVNYDISIINNKPYLYCVTEPKAGTLINTLLLVDTGAGLTALFHHNTDTLLQLSGQIINGSLGKGLGGDIEGFTGKIHKLHMGKLYFNNLLSSFQDLDESLIQPDRVTRNGLLGNLLLERFDVVLDLKKAKLFLKPHKGYNKTFEFDKSGLTLFAYGENLNQYYIKYVIEKSPAGEAGLMPGDIVMKIGHWSYKWYDLRRINKILSGRTGKTIQLKIRRGEQILNKKIILRDLFL